MYLICYLILLLVHFLTTFCQNFVLSIFDFCSFSCMCLPYLSTKTYLSISVVQRLSISIVFAIIESTFCLHFYTCNFYHLFPSFFSSRGRSQRNPPPPPPPPPPPEQKMTSSWPEVGKEEKGAAAQHKFRDKRKQALSDLLVNHPEAAISHLNQENFKVGGVWTEETLGRQTLCRVRTVGRNLILTRISNLRLIFE